MADIDTFGYLLELKRILFNEKEKKENFDVRIIRSNKTNNDSKEATAICIISLNTIGFSKDVDTTKYFYFVPNQPLKEISKETLQGNFDNLLYEYIIYSDSEIPGIKKGGRRC